MNREKNKKEVIIIKNITKTLGNKKIFKNFSLTVRAGEIVTVFGPNGSGKSTLMNMVAGIIPVDEGEIILREENLGYVFQNYRESLLPWRTNYRNLTFPLEGKGLSDKAITDSVAELQASLQLNINWAEYPYHLSGGQQQVLAFLRALITKPKVLLIDEALSALDLENNLFLRSILQQYLVREKPAVLMVTHNIEEAVHLGSRVLIFPRTSVGQIKTVENKDKYPRGLDYLTTTKFHTLKNKALSLFEEVNHITYV